MQTLHVKMPDKTQKTVYVHRSFQDISGLHIFLHHNGVYGYKDGSPVKSEQELARLPGDHKTLALAWWNRSGKEMSAAYYGQKEEELSKNAGDFQEQIAAEEFNTRLDSILYSRRAIGKTGRPAGAVSAPKPWLEFGFSKRPDWWGQARLIGFADFAYEMLNPVAGAIHESPLQESPQPEPSAAPAPEA